MTNAILPPSNRRSTEKELTTLIPLTLIPFHETSNHQGMMEQTITLLREPPLADTASPAQKRRKLRKGTQSCWECKRRKARCTFSADTPDTCDGCKRRGSDCVSQETTDQPPPPAGSNKQVVDRLGHVEALVGQLVKAARQTGNPDLTRTPRWSSGEESSSPELPVGPSGISNHNSSHYRSSESADLRQHSSEKDTFRTSLPSQDDAQNPESHDDLSLGLLKAWPKQQDLDIILGIPVQTSQIIRAVTCTRVDTNGSELPSPKVLLQLPPPGSHPTLIARKLLVLATFLQGIPESLAHHLSNLSTSYEEIMSLAVKATHKLVTSNDELVTSLEGIECILLEALYKNYAGDLRQSWLAARRAITIAQMLGMDRGVTPLSLSGSTIEPEDMWFRLVQFDRYIALMLGLPHTSVQDSFATPEVLENRTALERLLRLCCVACGRILQRSFADMYDPEITKDIDKLLQDASTGMPAQFWVIPTIPSSNEVSKIRETLRFNYHFMHYHLLLQLHLPYLLRQRSEHQYDYNRMTAVTASREMLSRFMSFRTVQAARFYCRGIDLITFLASTALCLAHVCDRSQAMADDNGFHFLAHQRLSDRGILEQVLDTMQSISHSKDDTISKRVVILLQYLLAIEEDAAAGGKYNAKFVPDSRVGRDELGYIVELVDSGKALEICLPHFSTLRIQHEGPEGRIPAIPASTLIADENQLNTGVSLLARVMPITVENSSSQECSITNEHDREAFMLGQNANESDWAFESLDFSYLDSFIEGALETDRGRMV